VRRGTAPELPKSLVDLYYDGKQSQADMDISVCKNQILNLFDLYDYTVIVLDALDECEPQSQVKLMETFEFLRSGTKRPLKIFVSSRPDPDILWLCQQWRTVKVQATQNHADIDTFVRTEMLKHGRWEKWPSSLREHIVHTISSGSNGM
jgi:hypothetical protein